MSNFIKVLHYDNNGYYNKVKVKYIKTDLITEIYEEEDSYKIFDFSKYFKGSGIVDTHITRPTIIVTKDGKKYYSPVSIKDLNDKDKREEILDRFDLLDL